MRGSKKNNGARTIPGVSLVLLVAALAVVAMFAAACGGDTTTTTAAGGSETTAGGTAPTGDPIVIGAIVSATGPAAALGEQERNVLEMQEDLINARGGILGRPVKIVIEDDKSDPKEAVTAANKLLTQDKAVAVIAATTSSSTLAVKEIAAQKGVPQMAMAAANDVTDKAPMEWIWRTPQKDALAVARALDYVVNGLKVKKVAVLHDENAFGSSGNAEIAKAAPALGLEVVAAESYKTADTDMTAQLTKIKNAGPSAIVVWTVGPVGSIVAKNRAQLGIDIPLFQCHGQPDPTYIELAGKAAEGDRMPSTKLMVANALPDADPQKAVIREFIRLYTDVYKFDKQFPINTHSGYAWDAITIVANAMRKAGTETKALRAAIEATAGYVGVSGIYNLTAEDHNGLGVDSLVMVQVKNGKFVLAE